jgi:spermidine/putrescine transport system permease protein
MMGNLIYAQFLTANDWPFGAAISMVLIAIMMALLTLQAIAAEKGAGERRGGADG